MNGRSRSAGGPEPSSINERYATGPLARSTHAWYALAQRSIAARVGALADSTNRLVENEATPAAQDLRKAIDSVQRAADNLDAVVADARPGIQNLTKSTLPEANRLVRDLRDLTESLGQFSDRLNNDGALGVLGPEKLPDYKPGKTK